MQKNFWARLPILVLMALIATFLWGSAFPCIKIGYKLLSIGAEDTPSQILFAGSRFTLAGIMVVVVACIQRGHFVLPGKEGVIPVIVLSLFQTIGQYFFFYIGLAHASGVSSSLIEATNTFLTILIAVLIFHTEKLTTKKVIGCILGFIGVAIIQLPMPGSGSGGFGFTMLGEGCILLSTVASAFSASLIKKYSKKEDPMILSGYQFILGGIVLALAGRIAGGRLNLIHSVEGNLMAGSHIAAACALLSYMAFISACAYTLWSALLKYNPVSRVAVFGFVNPVVGVILSAFLLGETNQAFSLVGLTSLILVSLGIIVVNRP